MLVFDRCIMYKLLIDHVPLVSVLFTDVNELTAFILKKKKLCLGTDRELESLKKMLLFNTCDHIAL